MNREPVRKALIKLERANIGESEYRDSDLQEAQNHLRDALGREQIDYETTGTIEE